MTAYRDFASEAFLSGGGCLRKAVGVYGTKFYVHPGQIEHVKSSGGKFVYIFRKNGRRKTMPNDKTNFQFCHIDNIASIEA